MASTNLAEIIETCQGKIVYVDNPPVEIKGADEEELEVNKEDRVGTREKIMDHLSKSCQEETYKPPKLQKLSSEIIKFMEEKIGLETKLEKKKLKKEKKVETKLINAQESKTEKSDKGGEDKLKSVSKENNETKLVINEEEKKTSADIEEEITKLESKIGRLKKEIREKEEIIRQKVLKHIFNNYKNIVSLQGGNTLIDSVIGDSNNWLNISAEFSNRRLIGRWLSHDFSYQQVEKLANDLKSVFNPTDASFYAWLRKNNQLVVKRLLNYDKLEQLKREYYYQLQKEEVKLENVHDWRNQQLSPEEIKIIIQHFKEEFKNWTSGNSEVDQFIQKYQLEVTKPKEILEWIPYERFTNIEYLAQGGFGKVYKAEWADGPILRWNAGDWERYKHKIGRVVLKSLNNNSQNTDFLQEVANHGLVDSTEVVSCYGISQNPQTSDYLMVMQYMLEGNLRNYLSNKNHELDFEDKIYQLYTISLGLKDIHSKKLVHRDFHSGNILIDGESCCITDLGLCKPVSEASKEKKVFGVLPYVAPEVLRQQPYTQKADVYSFGIIAAEIITGLPPYYDREHGVDLGVAICQGLRPQFQIKIPKLLEDLINRCWDINPSKRPTANELQSTLRDWQEDADFENQLQEAEEFNKTLPKEIRFPDYKTKTHSGAFYHSKLLPTKDITQLLKTMEFSPSIQLDFTRLNLEETKTEEEQLRTHQEAPPK